MHCAFVFCTCIISTFTQILVKMRYISIRDKLILNYVIIGILTILIIGGFSYHTAKEAVYKRTFDQLTSLRIAKKQQLENFFRERIHDIQLLSNTGEVKEILSAINKPPSNHTGKIATILPGNRNILKFIDNLAYYDRILLYTIDGGILSYSDSGYNHVDLMGCELLSENMPKHLLSEKDLFIGDLFSTGPYVGAPVKNKKGKISGAVLLCISLKSISDIMLDNNPVNGLGESGESYLVGPDYLMRSQSRFNDSSVMRAEVRTEGVRNAFEGMEGTSIIKDYRGINVLSSYSMVNVPGLHWAILAEIDTTEALESIADIRNSILLISTIIALLLFTYAFYASARFTSPIIKLKTATQQIAQGDFNPNLNIQSNDEIGELVESFRKMLAQLKKMTAELKKERFRRLRSVMDGQEIERQRLSRELHDGLGQLLIALKLQLENTHGADPDATKKAIREVNESFDMTIDEIRRISNNLMPSVLNEFGIVNALRNLADEMEEHSSIEVNFMAGEVSANLGKKQKTYIYRIAQEALNNAVKHSEASQIKIGLSQSVEYLSIRIEDNGKGFNYSEALTDAGNGLHNMRERCILLQGNFDLRTANGEGTLIVINIPL